MFKKILILMAAIVLLGTAPAFAEVPKNTVVIGGNAFDINLLFKPEYRSQILQAVSKVPAGTMPLYYKIHTMPQWKTIFGNTALTAEQTGQWPEITYINSEGESIIYEAGNGAEAIIGSFNVVDIY